MEDATEVGRRRRAVLKLLASLGVGAVFSRTLAAEAEGERKITEEMIRRAEWIAGVEYDDDERKLMLDGVNDTLEELDALSMNQLLENRQRRLASFGQFKEA